MMNAGNPVLPTVYSDRSTPLAVLYAIACAPENPFAVLLIALQLTAAGVITTLLDEVLAAGHGFCGGAKLFIATSACTAVFAGLFSPVAAGSVAAGESGAAEVQGALWAVFSLLGSRPNKLKALQEAIFYRGRGLPSIANVAVTLALAAAVAYLQVGDAWSTVVGG